MQKFVISIHPFSSGLCGGIACPTWPGNASVWAGGSGLGQRSLVGANDSAAPATRTRICNSIITNNVVKFIPDSTPLKSPTTWELLLFPKSSKKISVVVLGCFSSSNGTSLWKRLLPLRHVNQPTKLGHTAPCRYSPQFSSRQLSQTDQSVHRCLPVVVECTETEACRILRFWLWDKEVCRVTPKDRLSKRKGNKAWHVTFNLTLR